MDPESITLEQVRAAVEALGIDPDLRHVREIRIEPRDVTITRYQTTESGAHRIIPGTPTMLTETSVIRMVEK